MFYSYLKKMKAVIEDVCGFIMFDRFKTTDRGCLWIHSLSSITYYTPRFILFSIGFDIDGPSKNSKEENMSVAMVT